MSTDRTDFEVEPQADGRFAVIASKSEIRFVGTLAECSEWLDAQEARMSNPPSVRGDLLDPDGFAGR